MSVKTWKFRNVSYLEENKIHSMVPILSLENIRDLQVTGTIQALLLPSFQAKFCHPFSGSNTFLNSPTTINSNY